MGRRSSQATHVDWYERVGFGVVSQFALFAVTPAHHVPRGHSAAVSRAGSDDCDTGPKPLDDDRSGHFRRGRVVADLPIGVLSPTFGRAIHYRTEVLRPVIEPREARANRRGPGNLAV